MEAKVVILRQATFRLLPPMLVMTDGVNAPRSHLLRQRGDFIRGNPAPQDQPGSLVPQRLVESLKAMMQPPALRAADAPVARAFIVEHIDRDDGPLPRRRDQRCLIGQAQILPEPED